MNRKQEKAMFAKGHNSSSIIHDPKQRFVWYDHNKAKQNEKYENLKSIPRDAPNTIKYCSRCNKSFDYDQAKANQSHGLVCNGCNAKGLKSSTYPAHWVWNKMSIDQKKHDLIDVGIPKSNHEPYTIHDALLLSTTDFDDLPKELRKRLRKKWGVSPE